MQTDEPKSWKSYEEVARYLLEQMRDEFGLDRVEGKQKLDGQSGTSWEIDAKGIKANSDEIVVIECRRYTTSKLKQEGMGALAYRINDLGAVGGIVVTPVGVQQGAEIIAGYEGIEVVRLAAEATTTDYIMEFLNKVHIGRSVNLWITPKMTVLAELVEPATPPPPAPAR